MSRFFLLLLSSLASITLPAQLIIRNVNVIDVGKKTILKNQDVLVEDTRILKLGKSLKIKTADSHTVIDGTGKYLLPGLTDAHIHFFQSGGLYARPDAINLEKYRPYKTEIAWTHEHMNDFLRRYVAAGITGVVDVGSSFNFLRHRDTMQRQWFTPDIRITGPLLTTYVPKTLSELGADGPFIKMNTEEDSREAVRKQHAAKADFIKIWYIVSDSNIEAGARKNLPLVKAAIDEAHRLNLRVAVHATEQITARLAVEAGADFLVHNVEDEVISDSFVKLLRDRKTVLAPTLVVAGNYVKVFSGKYPFTRQELSLAHPTTVGSIIDYPYPDTALAANYIRVTNSPAYAARQKTMDSITAVNLMKLVNGGVIIATGTDAGNTGTQHVSSYFIELDAMKAAGMNNWQILQASTINAAEAVGTSKTRGSISAGKTADMILLAGNPVDSLSALLKPELVILNGRLIRPDTLVKHTPEMLAQQQLNAYNAHNLEAFLEPYSEDVEVYEFPAKLMYKGKSEMRKQYDFLNRGGKLYCRLLNRVVQGNIVIDHEEILGVPGSPHYGIAIYEVENGKIKKVYFPD